MSSSAVVLEKGLPANLDAERFVLGSILLDDSYFIQTAGALQADDFSVEKHRRIFTRMAEIHDRGEKIDRVTLANELMSRNQLEACDGLSYLVSLDDPVPDTPERSMIRMTDGGWGGRVLLVSSTSSLEIRACPENLTLSGCPLTVPETGIRATVGAKAARAGVPAHHRSPDRTTAKSDSATAPTGNRRIFMFRSFSIRSS